MKNWGNRAGNLNQSLLPHEKMRSIFGVIKNKTSDLKQGALFYISNSSWSLRGSMLLLAVLLTTALTIPPTLAATATLVPNGDVTAQWPELGGVADNSCSGTSCMRVDEGATSNDTDYVGTGTNGAGGEVLEFDLTTAASVDNATDLSLLVRNTIITMGGNSPDTLTVQLIINGTAFAPSTTSSSSVGGYTNLTLSFSGTWTQADVDNMRVRITRNVQGGGPGTSRDDEMRISNVYGTLTYTQAVTYDQSSYRWFSNSNTLVRSSDNFTKLADPSSLPASNSYGSAFSPNDRHMAVAHEVSPFISIYKRNGDSFSRLPNPDVLPTGIGHTPGFSPDGQHMAVAHVGSPYLSIYKRNGDSFTKLANPSSLPPSDSYAVSYTPDSQYLATAHSSSPYVSIYKRSGDTYTKLANPASLPPGAGSRATFSPDGTYLSVTSHTTAPFLTIYKRSGDTFTKLPDLANPPTGNAMNSAFSNDGSHYAVTFAVSPFIHIYKRSGDTFTKLPDPATLPTGIPRGLVFSADDQYLMAGHEVSPFITIYKRSGDTFTKIANPSTLPTGNGRMIAMSPNMQYLSVSHYTSPFVSVYKNPVNAGAGAAMATVNTATTAPVNGTVFRLRTLVSTNIAQADPYASSFKLQYAEKGVASSCSSVAMDKYADVTAATPIAYANNSNIPTGVNITSTADDPANATTVHPQTYVEANNFSNANSAIPLSESGMWDFALKDNNAPVATTYCFRIVNSSGAALATYEQFPEITTQASTVEQANWRAYEPGVAASGDFVKLADPATLPSGAGRGVTFSHDDTYVAVSHEVSPFLTIYKRSGDTFTKLADPAVLPTGLAHKVAFSPDSTYMTVVHEVSPFITIYKRSGDTFTKLADPATLPPSISYGVTFSNDGTYMTVGHAVSPFMTIYKRSGDTFTKLADPDVILPGNGNAIAFSPDDSHMSVAHGGSTNATIYKRSGDIFTKLADPAELPAGGGFAAARGVAYSPDGVYMTITHSLSPYVLVYKREGDVYTKLANPAVLPTGVAFSPAFSPDGLYLTVTHDVSPFITIYKRSGDTFTKLADPATLPSDDGYSAAYSKDGSYKVVGHNLSPFITIYKTPPKPVPGTPFAAQNTAPTLTAGDSFRLRQLLEQTSSRSDLNSASYKLQFAAKSGTCDAGFSGEAYSNLYTATSGDATRPPTFVMDDNSDGGVAWSNLDFANISDDVRADVSLSGTGPSTYLKATDFGFTIPSNATIGGVEVRVEGYKSGPGTLYTEAMRLVKGGAIGTTNVFDPNGWTANTDTVMVHGSSTELWGTTLTPADINATNFGFALRVNGEQFDQANVDHIQITIHYTVPSAGTPALTYNTTTGITSGATISTHANDPTATGTIKPQTFASTDPFSNSVSAIAFGESAMWDFAVSTTASATGSYCFRVVKSDGSLLNSYSQIPEITIAGSGGGGPSAPTLDQQVRGGQSVVNGVKAPFSW